MSAPVPPLPSPSLNCPKCGSVSIRRTRSGPLDRLFGLFGLRTVKCRECRCRFRTRFVQSSSAPQTSRSTSGKRSESDRRRRAVRRRELQVYAYALAGFLLMLYVITRERGLSE